MSASSRAKAASRQRAQQPAHPDDPRQMGPAESGLDDYQRMIAASGAATAAPPEPVPADVPWPEHAGRCIIEGCPGKGETLTLCANTEHERAHAERGLPFPPPWFHRQRTGHGPKQPGQPARYCETRLPDKPGKPKVRLCEEYKDNHAMVRGSDGRWRLRQGMDGDESQVGEEPGAKASIGLRPSGPIPEFANAPRLLRKVSRLAAIMYGLVEDEDITPDEAKELLGGFYLRNLRYIGAEETLHAAEAAIYGVEQAVIRKQERAVHAEAEAVRAKVVFLPIDEEGVLTPAQLMATVDDD